MRRSPRTRPRRRFCDEEPNPGPGTCPRWAPTTWSGDPRGDKTEEEFCDEDDEEDVCPRAPTTPAKRSREGTTEESFCDDEDVNPGPNCEEDPSQPRCDEDNPPVVVPNEGNSPSNGTPDGEGCEATAPTAVAGTPAARVPTSVNAGLG